MSLKKEIETWVAALAAYDHNEFDSALRCFEQIADTSKILFNTGVIHATLGEHARAIACYQRAVQLDQYLAVAYFQQGVSNFLMGDFEEALANFNDTLLYLRGNNHIDYEQLGLKFKLYSCEVLFNRGLCYIYLQQKDGGMQDLMFAAREKVVPDHDVIDEAIGEQAEGYTVFSIPVGMLYRPNEAKVKNLKTKDYLGKARLVAAQQDQQRQSADPRRQAALAALSLDDRPEHSLSYAALNLVKPDLRSRSRQQSEPPLHRNVFPPTPPPEAERPISAHSKHKSSESAHSNPSNLQQARPGAKPLRLELGAAAFEQKVKAERPGTGARRAESERPPPRKEYHPNTVSRPSNSSRPKQERQDFFREGGPEVYIQDDPLEACSSQIYQAQPPHFIMGHHRARSSANHSHYLPIEEEPEEEEDSTSQTTTTNESADDDEEDEDPLAFEIIAPKPHYYGRHRNSYQHSYSHSNSHSRRSPRLPAPAPAPAPAPDPLRKIRVKVHAADDMRYVMTTSATPFPELTEQIRVKISGSGAAGLGASSTSTSSFKIKIRDEEGDMVTIGDQEDWEMAVAGCWGDSGAGREGELGKLEVWIVREG
ncbi:hypothetical protein B0A50_01286 [Salinomyces thailandicus]|uniref:PB1 domain-containing protein n=1 Tax=Salinomyces thailandicus TaxID=706561 RepID=A0A4U0U9K7_9PEZI|nr:hypothetical protein B0A50_01286 [Salinomyces thailandica]